MFREADPCHARKWDVAGRRSRTDCSGWEIEGRVHEPGAAPREEMPQRWGRGLPTGGVPGVAVKLLWGSTGSLCPLPCRRSQSGCGGHQLTPMTLRGLKVFSGGRFTAFLSEAVGEPDWNLGRQL